MSKRIDLLNLNLGNKNGGVAIFEKERAITFNELRKGIKNLSTNIMNIGAEKDSTIALCFENTAEFVHGYYAVLEADCIPVLLSPNLPTEKIAYILEDSGAIGMLSDFKTFRKINSRSNNMRFAFLGNIGDSSTVERITVHSFEEGIRSNATVTGGHSDNSFASEDIPPHISDIAAIIYTSGTSGKPKGVMLSTTNLLVAISAIEQRLEIMPSDVCLVAMSFAHCAGLLHLLAHLRVGAKLVTGENPALIGSFLAAIKKHRVTILPGVPSFYTILMNLPSHKIAPYLRHIRAVESSSAMLNSSLVKKIFDLFPSAALFNTYGLTEAPRATYMQVSSSNSDLNLSVGLATEDINVQIVNQHHQICKPYEEGEIIISGPNVALGYWNNPVKTDAVFNSGSFKTGDIGFVDRTGFLFLQGRKDDMIKIGAEAVYPSEIEEVVASCPGISDVMAYGVEDELHGFRIHIKAVCTDKNMKEDTILDHCRDKLEKYKIPSRIIFCDKIELAESGKPKRYEVSP